MVEAPVNVAHALCVYAEPLAARRRVVVIGDSSLGLDARLVTLGARTVHLYDPDPERARANAQRAARGVVVRELPAGDLDVRDGAFDLAIVPDLAAVEDRAALLVRIRRLVGAEGATLIAARSVASSGSAALGTAGLDYYEMYELVALQFASVRMIGQVPFAGVTLAELGESDEEPAVSVDTQLIEANDEPEAYIALAAQHDVRLEAYSIVQLPLVPPAAPTSPASVEPRAPDARDSVGPSEADLAAAILRAELAESQLDEQRDVVARLAGDAERSSRQGELEASLQDRTNKLKDAETRAGDHYVRAERLTHDVRRLEEELQRQRDRGVRLAKEVDDEKKSRARAEIDLGMVRKNPELAEARARVALLEEALRVAEEAVVVLQQRTIEAETAIAVREAQLVAVGRELEALSARPARPIGVAPEIVAAVQARAQQAEARAALLDAQLAEHAEAQGADLAELEALLRQRAQALAALEHELVRREGMVRELIGALEEAGSSEDAQRVEQAENRASHAAAAASSALDALRGDLEGARAENNQLRPKLDALALEVARREGELQARSWRIAELEERVASLEARPAPAAERPASAAGAPGAAGSNVIAEMNALRTALAQEHEARVSAESGEELTRARADIARQAVLLEQLGRELEARDRAAAASAANEPTGQAPNAAQT